MKRAFASGKAPVGSEFNLRSLINGKRKFECKAIVIGSGKMTEIFWREAGEAWPDFKDRANKRSGWLTQLSEGGRVCFDNFVA